MDTGLIIPPRAEPPIKKREELELLQLVMLDDIALSQREIANSLNRERFRGFLDFKTISATEVVGMVDLRFLHPWVTASFYNDGPNTVYIAVNGASKWLEIKNGENLTVDFQKADVRITLVFYKCNAGETASARVIGKY